MMSIRLCISSCIFSFLVVFSGCESTSGAVPAFTLDVLEAPSGIEMSFEPSSPGRVVVAEVFTYDE